MIENIRVVITGCGVLSNIGDNLEDFWSNLCCGKIGYSKVESINTEKYLSSIGGQIKDYNAQKYIPEFDLKAKYLGKTSQYAISAAYLALNDSGLQYEKLKNISAGCAIGTTDGEPQSIENMNMTLAGLNKEFDYEAISLISPHRIAQSVAREFGLSGHVCTFGSACTAANHAISYAYEKIRANEAQIMLAGGADSFSRKSFTGFNRLGATAKKRCAAFDAHRDGMVVSEGAGIVVLESLEHALKRNAKIYAEIVGCGVSCDAHHMTMPNEKGITLAMENALKDAGIKASDIDYISAHGTGTQANDKVESNVINQIYGDNVPVSSNKSILGHTMGAASALNVITVVMAMQKGLLPKSSNINSVDSNCKINCLLENKSSNINYGQANGFAFGGNNGVVILKNGNLIRGKNDYEN